MRNKFLLLKDNVGLKYLFDKKTLNACQAKSLAFLSEYDFEIKHISRKDNILVDALSRQQHHLHSVLLSNYESKFKTSLKEALINDEHYGNWMKKCNQKNLGTDENLYQIDTEGFLHFKNQIYVPNQYSIKQVILRNCMKTRMQDTLDIKNL